MAKKPKSTEDLTNDDFDLIRSYVRGEDLAPEDAARAEKLIDTNENASRVFDDIDVAQQKEHQSVRDAWDARQKKVAAETTPVDRTPLAQGQIYKTSYQTNLVQEVAGAAAVKVAMLLDNKKDTVSNKSINRVGKFLSKVGLGLGSAEVTRGHESFFVPVVGILNKDTFTNPQGVKVYVPPKKDVAPRKFDPLMKLKT